MKKVLIILADGFEELEAVAPIDLLKRAGAEVIIAGAEQIETVSSHKTKIVCDTLLSAVNSDKWDAVVLPGGMPGAVNLHNCKAVNDCILNTYKNGGYVCAICASPAVVFAPLGILDGKRAVCYPGCEKGIKNVEFCSDKVLKTDRIITARGAGCAVEFGLEIVSALFSRDVADDLAVKIVY